MLDISKVPIRGYEPYLEERTWVLSVVVDDDQLGISRVRGPSPRMDHLAARPVIYVPDGAFFDRCVVGLRMHRLSCPLSSCSESYSTVNQIVTFWQLYMLPID